MTTHRITTQHPASITKRAKAITTALVVVTPASPPVPVDNTLAAWQAIVTAGLTSDKSKAAYAMMIKDFYQFWLELGRPFPTTLQILLYKDKMTAMMKDKELSASTINLRLAVIKRWAGQVYQNRELIPDSWRAGVTRDWLADIQSVKGIKRLGVRQGNWLSLNQAQALMDAVTGDDPITLRDRAILAMLLGCGLRRSELARLSCDVIQEREGRPCIIDLTGKGGRIRSMGIPAWTYHHLTAWLDAGGIVDGYIFRAFTRGRKLINRPVTSQQIYNIFKAAASKAGLPPVLAPHDARRTFAHLSRDAGASIEDISQVLGHSDITTTARYLGNGQCLKHTPADKWMLK